MGIPANDKIAKDLCDALGLKHVKELDIHMAAGEIFTASVKFYPDKDGVKQLPLMFQRFKLVAKGEPQECPTAVEMTSIGEELANYDYSVVK